MKVILRNGLEYENVTEIDPDEEADYTIRLYRKGSDDPIGSVQIKDIFSIVEG